MKKQIEQLQAELLEAPKVLKQKIALLETSNMDLQKQLQEHQVLVESLTKQVTDTQILKQKIALLETSNMDLQKQLKERQVHVEYLTKQLTDTKQLKERQVHVEYLTKQLTDTQILKQKMALLETSNMDLRKQLKERQVHIEYLTKQLTDTQEKVPSNAASSSSHIVDEEEDLSLEALIARRPPSPKLDSLVKNTRRVIEAPSWAIDSVIEEILRGGEPKPRIPTHEELAQEPLLQFFNSADKEALKRVQLDDLQDIGLSEKQVEYIIKNAASFISSASLHLQQNMYALYLLSFPILTLELSI
ncbi:P-loop containing nucleoside triphosphate hydrolases superfamily protein [Artemisia annua]|uniref:P-loop containing nucleoside triphosphate hydrolases superfamily protein n=1 Tax=Artemisia annua TaxID=35608 RepID=A0A2U1LF77_ARTAN|nr:P-loop containing nucleoside triphosphate hydrolases superfamily protein [Artemisia annua]